MTDLKFVDEMSVKLLSVSGNDEQLARAAWVSTGNEGESERTAGLLNALLRMKHGTPFEHAQMIFHCHVTLNVRSEHHRHRIGWSYNEQSGRYTPYQPVFYMPPPDRPMIKPESLKMMKPSYNKANPIEYGIVESSFYDICKHAWDEYQLMLNNGIAGELARMVLPGCLMTTYWATANPRSIMHFIGLRTHEESANHPSYPMEEMEQVGRQIEFHFSENFPLTYAAFVKNGREAP